MIDRMTDGAKPDVFIPENYERRDRDDWKKIAITREIERDSARALLRECPLLAKMDDLLARIAKELGEV